MSQSGRPMESVAGPHANQPLLTAGAPAAAAEASLILLHGRGATAQGVVNLLEPARRHCVAVFAPQAFRSRWFTRPADTPIEENEPDLTSAVECVDAAIEAASEIGISPRKTVIAGFSQGACVAAEFAARRPTRYGGVVLLSGTLPGPVDHSRSFQGSLDGTPVFLGYGEADPALDREAIKRTETVFESLDGVVTTRAYSGVGHEVVDDEFEVVGSLLDAILDD